MSTLPLWGGLLAIAGIAGPLYAQDPPEQDPPRTELSQMRQELDALRQKSDADQARIQDLEARLMGLEAQAVAAPLYQDVPLQDPLLLATPMNNILNPMITVFIDTFGVISDNGDDNLNNRFSLREVELDLRAPITHQIDGVLITALAEEVEQDLSDGTINVAFEVAVEEGYVDFHTLPAQFGAKVGQFRTQFGRNNLLHVHDLPQVDRPLAVQAILGPEGLISTGVSVDRTIPNPWDGFVNGWVQVLNSDGGESPLLDGPNAPNPSVLGHLTIFEDTGDTSFAELGGSYLYGYTGDTHTMTSNTFGVDFTWMWQDPSFADWHSFLFQTEGFWTDVDVDNAFGTFTQESYGWYAFAQYQFSLNWYGGVRYDWTEYPNNEERSPMDRDWAVSPYVSWYISEFLRLRFQYQYLDRRVSGVDRDEHIFFLNLTGVFGSHPAHPYWVAR